MINRKVGSDLEENCRLTLTVGSTEESYKIGQSYNSTVETNVCEYTKRYMHITREFTQDSTSRHLCELEFLFVPTSLSLDNYYEL
jgi:hypothetical protein